MLFDLTVLVLTAVKLGFAPQGTRSRLVKLIFQDGLIYFVIALTANTVATVFMLLNLNAVMSIIFDVPAAVFSTVSLTTDNTLLKSEPGFRSLHAALSAA